jgi:hypothetical protein
VRNFVVETDFDGGRHKDNRPRVRSKAKTYWCFFISAIFILSLATLFPVFGQNFTSAYTPGQQPGNYLKNSAAFRQEIARMEIKVVRGEQSLPITQIPRVQKDDVIKMRLLDEAVGGIKPDQSYWDWTFVVAYVNPNRNIDKQKSVSEEVRFKKSGWYREYSFVVPYDAQPVFFLYPKPKYRGKILNLINKKFEEVRKLGEKTIEIAGAYAQIDSFLNELQFVLYQTQQSRYGQFITYPGAPNGTTGNNPYNPYGTYNPFTGTNPLIGNNANRNPEPIINYNALVEQTIERLARSFNIQLPQCWQSQNGGINYNSYGGYNSGSFGSYGSTYGGSYSSSPYGGTYGSTTNNSFGYAVSADLIGRAQCVAKSVRIEDFDLSLASVLKQGGIFAMTQLRDKYPQLAYWISIAAAALDFIVKAFQKMPLRVVPAIIQTSDNLGQSSSYQSTYSSSYSSSSYQAGNSTSGTLNNQAAQPVKISLYAESQPGDDQFVSAYPIVVHKWQQEPDPEVISLRPPVLAEPCLHTGMNLLKNSDLTADLSADNYTKDFKLVMSGGNGFRKEFPLKKNLGLGGWELNLTSEDLNSIPKVQMALEAEMTGMRGFNELKSPKFDLPLSTGASWQIVPESQRDFVAGGRRRITLRNTLGSCRCLQAVIYKPGFGGQFIFEANARSRNNQLEFSVDGREVSFEIDASSFQPGQGTLEIKTYGDPPTPQMNQGQQQSNILPIKLYPLPPIITDVKIAKGDKMAIITGERLEQLRYVKINGKRANVIGNNPNQGTTSGFGNQQNNFNMNQAGQSSMQNPNQNQPQNPSNQIQSQNGAQNSNAIQSQSLAYSLNLNPNQRAAFFDDLSVRQTSSSVALELGLEDDRTFVFPQTFSASAARPMLEADDQNEIEGVFIKSAANVDQSKSNNLQQIISPQLTTPNSQLTTNLVVSTDAAQMSIVVRNKLTDYDFKGENLQVETRIENGQMGTVQSPQVAFDVLDANTLRLNFTFTEDSKKFIGGRRLQFRIKDRERGNSDWYTIRQTFVRLPKIETVKCTSEMNGQCELKGEGIDYISQVSVDGGKTWFPGAGQALQAQVSVDGKTVALIPLLTDKKLLQIKLRDYPNMEGIAVTDFIFLNSVRNISTKRAQSQTQNQMLNQPNNNSVPGQSPNQTPNQPDKVKPLHRTQKKQRGLN